jgi:phosphoglycerate dehydrogenase-like enzyme
MRSVEDLQWTDLETLLRTSDVVSLHFPLIDEQALADALNAGKLAPKLEIRMSETDT